MEPVLLKKFFNVGFEEIHVVERTPFGLEDQLALDLARESGLVTPECFPAWVRINNSHMGVDRYIAQPG